MDNYSVLFTYNDRTIYIHGNKNFKMEYFFDKFCGKTYQDETKLLFYYNGIPVYKDLTAGELSRNSNIIKILVMKIKKHSGDINISVDENKNKIIVNINYNDEIITIECNPEEKMEKVYQKLSKKEDIDINSIYLNYNGRVIIQKVKFQDFLNYDGKKRNEIQLYATLKDHEFHFRRTKKVICPICGESAQVEIKNYKISIHECKYNHKIDDLNFNEFETSQLINESKIMCNKCDRSKKDTYKNDFYVCNSCNLNLCPLCKTNHDKAHNIIHYDDKYFICGLHNELYSLYCKNCKKNICTLCEQNHGDHDVIRFEKLIVKKNDLENRIKEFKKSLDKFKEDIKKIINIFQKVLDNCESIYKFNEELIQNFDMKKINYNILKSLKEFYNDDISKTIENINNYENYGQKITQICKMYNCIDNYKLNINFISGETEKIINASGDELMTVIFISDDQKVHYSLICKKTDKFKDIEERLYKIYPDYAKTNNFFLVNGNTINKSKTLEEIKIKNSNIITLYVDNI